MPKRETVWQARGALSSSQLSLSRKGPTSPSLLASPPPGDPQAGHSAPHPLLGSPTLWRDHRVGQGLLSAACVLPPTSHMLKPSAQGDGGRR